MLYYLTELLLRANNPGALGAKYGGATFDRIRDFCVRASRATLLDERKFAELSGFDNMDAEAFLYAGALEVEDSNLVIGDIRSLAAFALNASATDKREMQGRVLLVEGAFLKISQAHPWGMIEPRLLLGTAHHREIVAAIEEARAGGKVGFEASLVQSLNALPRALQPFLVPYP